MKIRTKLIMAMSSVVVLMMLLFLFLIQILFFISRDLSYFSNKAEIERVEQSMVSYYQEHDTWEEISKQELPTDMPFVLLDKEGKLLWKSGDIEEDTVVNTAFPSKIKISEQKIAKLYVMTPAQYQVYLVKNTWGKYMYGVIGLALIIGLVFTFFLILILSSTLTKPINVITKKIKNFEKGDSNVDFQMARKDEFKKISDALASMQQNLDMAEEARKTLASNIAHELNTPLMVIQGEIELVHLQQKIISVEKYNSISNEIMRLTGIINDILYLSKIEARQVKIIKQEIQLSSLFEQLEMKTQLLFRQHNADLFIPNVKLQTIWADEDKMLQVLYNLVTNALVHGLTTTQVIIEAKSDRDETILSITDDGIGLTESDSLLIFERFYRGDESRNRKTGGTGIGLSIVKAYLEMHEGRIEAEGRPGKGATFKIYLPNKPLFY